MQNDNFWNELLRKKVKEYIAADAFLSKLKTEGGKQVEDSLILLLRTFKEDIFREVDREYLREDVTSKVKERFGDKSSEFISGLPINLIKPDC